MNNPTAIIGDLNEQVKSAVAAQIRIADLLVEIAAITGKSFEDVREEVLPWAVRLAAGSGITIEDALIYGRNLVARDHPVPWGGAPL